MLDLNRTLAAALLTCAACGADAQVLKISPAASAPLSRAELRQCLDAEDALLRRQQAQDAERREIERENTGLAQEASQLAEDLHRTDTRDFSKVDGYNARAAAHEQRAKALNERVARFNDAVAVLNAEGHRHLAQCASRPFAVEDRDAILRERKRLSPQVREH